LSLGGITEPPTLKCHIAIVIRVILIRVLDSKALASLILVIPLVLLFVWLVLRLVFPARFSNIFKFNNLLGYY
jgi:hypothetical protein